MDNKVCENKNEIFLVNYEKQMKNLWQYILTWGHRVI